MNDPRPAKPGYTPAPLSADYWPEAGQAMAYLSRVQVLLDTRRLTGREKQLKPLPKRAAEAFKARDLAAVNAVCDAVVDAVNNLPAP